MITSEQRMLGDMLEQVAISLDIPEELYEQAVGKYEHLGHWLEEDDQKQNRREPKIYPQGSFRLGTVVRPVFSDDYDIDLVYERDLRKGSISQEQLKEDAGDSLRRYIKHCQESHCSVPKLDSGRRCWTLDYPENFHMDVLPAIPDDEGRQIRVRQSETRILIPDRELHNWQHSNPIGYGEWFKSRMAVRFHEKRVALAAQMMRAAEDVPEYKIKTPLQRAIQILKRHRDFYFQEDADDKPISIIITTLAAKAYNNEAGVAEAALAIVRNMPAHIEIRHENGKRVVWVPNPVNEEENFADKWEEHPQRERKFREWLSKVDEDLSVALLAGDFRDLVDILGGCLGNSIVLKAAAACGYSQAGASLALTKQSDSVPAIAATRHCQLPPWTRDLKYNVSVTATVHRHQKQPKIFDLTYRPVPKDLWLRFEASTDARQPYEVHWQVVNTGEDAVLADGLRGGFDDNQDPGPVHWEYTSYAGTHWVEAFVVRNGYCVARSGRHYVRIPE